MNSQFRGTIVAGKKRGAQLGFPTINIAITAAPAEGWGIYFSSVEIEGVQYKGVTHVGPVPTFGDEQATCETFLFDATGDFYGKAARKLLLKKHRDVKNFVSVEELKKTIADDIAQAKKYFNL